MKAGFVYSLQRRAVYYKLKRQIVAEYRLELGQTTGLKRSWLRWKRRVALESRYNQLLFSSNQQLVY